MGQRGGSRPGAGAKKKADSERIRDMLSPYMPEAIETVVNIMRSAPKESDRLSAAKLLMSYSWGLPTQTIDATSDGQPFNITIRENGSGD